MCWTLRGPQVPRARAQVPATNYKNFEAPQVHPLALTPDGTRLLALDTPEQRLEVFQLNGSALTLAAEIAVGAEPTSIAVRNNSEVWVANWLSDSVSVVDLNAGNVTRAESRVPHGIHQLDDVVFLDVNVADRRRKQLLFLGHE